MYNKLFSKIVDSSIWMEPDHVRLIWMMFIAIMDEDGFVNLATVRNVAHRAVMDVDKAEEALSVLEDVDPESSNPENEGRRLTRVPGGWMVNNAGEYRSIVKREHQKELNRERVRKHRSKKSSCNGDVMGGNDVSENVTPSDTEADTEAEALFTSFWDAFAKKVDRKKAVAAFAKALKAGVDAEMIISKAREYSAACTSSGSLQKHPTTWLNGECWNDEDLPQSTNGTTLTWATVQRAINDVGRDNGYRARLVEKIGQPAVDVLAGIGFHRIWHAGEYEQSKIEREFLEGMK